MRRDTLYLLAGIVALGGGLIWILYQNLTQNIPQNPSGAAKMFKEEYGAKPYTGKKLILSNKEWKERMTSEQYYVMREDGTEPTGSDKQILDNTKPGIYVCSACELSLFSSKTKYKSGTGWPSFWAPIDPSHVGYKIDHTLFSSRVEVHCNRCESHLGHVFNDGPPPTGHRYCINGVALKFIPQQTHN